MLNLEILKKDYEAAYNKPASLKRLISRIYADPSFRVLARFRIAQYLYKLNLLGKVVAQFLWRRNVFRNGCYISLTAEIGSGFVLPHATGIVIGENVKIGNNVRIFQNVTLGVASANSNSYPVVGHNVVIYTGACIVGAITIKDGCIIAANAVVNKDIDAYTLVAGVPARPVKTLR